MDERRCRHDMMICSCSAFHWDLPQTENIFKMAHIGRLHVRLQLIGFTTFPQRILCRHLFRGRSYIT